MNIQDTRDHVYFANDIVLSRLGNHILPKKDEGFLCNLLPDNHMHLCSLHDKIVFGGLLFLLYYRNNY